LVISIDHFLNPLIVLKIAILSIFIVVISFLISWRILCRKTQYDEEELLGNLETPQHPFDRFFHSFEPGRPTFPSQYSMFSGAGGFLTAKFPPTVDIES
jgi:hypothetical protein